jgi:hypothetical protein
MSYGSTATSAEEVMMRKRLVPMVMVAGIGLGGLAMGLGTTASAAKPTCNWGNTTSSAIAAGFDQGAHASDPAGDGRGSGGADQPRAGLANVVNQGDLNALCELLTP